MLPRQLICYNLGYFGALRGQLSSFLSIFVEKGAYYHCGMGSITSENTGGIIGWGHPGWSVCLGMGRCEAQRIFLGVVPPHRVCEGDDGGINLAEFDTESGVLSGDL